MDSKMNTLDYIVNKYNIDLSQPSPIFLPIGRRKDFPILLNELGFKTGVEIGVFRGEYSAKLMHYIPGLKLYAIDPWTAYPGYSIDSKRVAEAYDLAVANTSHYSGCTLIRDYSENAVKGFTNNSLDFVYVDGNHSFENTVWDIAQWSRKVRPGGIVAGHDFDDWWSVSRHWYEMNVAEAVTSWTRAMRIAPWFVLTNNKNKTWFYVKE